MTVTRRNTIIALAGVAGGAGLIGGSGAFDSVSADRSFEVSVGGDADGLLGIEVGNEAIAQTESGGAGGNEVIVFRLQNAEDAINEDATSDFFEVFSLTNNGSNDVDVRIDLNDATGITFETSEGEVDLTETFASLEPTETIDVDLQIDTTEGGYSEPEGEDPYQITIIAESDAAQDAN